jgi:hypothetical protein
MTVPGTNTTDSMSQIDPIAPMFPLDRTVMNRKSHGIALSKRNHLWSRLHARTLLGQHEFATSKVCSRFREQNRNLDGEHVLAIEILMEAVVIACTVLEQQWRWLELPSLMATRQKVFVLFWIPNGKCSPMAGSSIKPTT